MGRYLERLLHVQDHDTLSDALWCFSYLADGPAVQAVIETGAVAQMVGRGGLRLGQRGWAGEREDCATREGRKLSELNLSDLVQDCLRAFVQNFPHARFGGLLGSTG